MQGCSGYDSRCVTLLPVLLFLWLPSMQQPSSDRAVMWASTLGRSLTTVVHFQTASLLHTVQLHQSQSHLPVLLQSLVVGCEAGMADVASRWTSLL